MANRGMGIGVSATSASCLRAASDSLPGTERPDTDGTTTYARKSDADGRSL